MSAPSILLSGYFGFGNTGDEAILQAQLQTLRDLSPELDLAALVADPGQPLEQARVVARQDPIEVLTALRRCDLLISGGGGLLQDSTGPKSIIYYLGLCALAKLLGKRVMFYCQGYGPVRSKWGRTAVKLVADRVDLITVRDQQSADDLKAAGVRRTPVVVTADPGLSLKPEPPAELRPVLQEEGLLPEFGRLEGPTGRHQGVGPLVAVTVRPWPGFSLEALADALYKFRSEQRARYLVIPFHPQLDREPSLRLQELLEGEAKVLSRDYSPSQLTGILHCCDMVVGMRLHSLILAASAGIPLLGLSYDPKVKRFCQRAGALHLDLEEISDSKLVEAMTHLLEGRAHQRKTQKQAVAPMVEVTRRTAQAAICLASGGQLKTALDILR